MIDHDALAALLGEHLPRQRWFAPDGDAGARVAATEVLAEPWPGLLHVSVEAAGGCWQVVLGLRPAGEHHVFLEGKPEAVVGELDTPAGPALAYDALVDPELALVLLRLAAPTVEAERARPITGLEQSNSSVVFDEAVILKLYRRLLDGPNPDAEVTRALAGAGFDGVAEPCGRWREADQDRAVANRFLSNGTDGFSLALTSLRDLFGSGGEPGDAGGDFAPDARRLGGITAAMHLALAKAFATKSGRPGRWADEAADS
ncbi:MAG: hypothetical protein H0U89_07945, partial [Acidimicrobiia bacterium]|nr:hypothetical protein [Acidimicrobiia bacterium]